jgi:tRNA G18 (ribose-2'-O)-methylase SpoU
MQKLWLCGISGIPPDSKISKTALGAEKTVLWEYRRDPLECIQNLKGEGWQIVLLEQADCSVSYEDFIPKGPVCLVVGNEIEGVSAEILDRCDAAIDIEMAGLKNSLNVAVAFGIAAYHIRSKLKGLPAVAGPGKLLSGNTSSGPE